MASPCAGCGGEGASTAVCAGCLTEMASLQTRLKKSERKLANLRRRMSELESELVQTLQSVMGTGADKIQAVARLTMQLREWFKTYAA